MATGRGLGLIALLKSDLERHYHYTGRPGRSPRATELWRNFLVPRCAPVALYRVSRWLLLKRLGPLAKLVTWLNFYLYGIEIAAQCDIGPYLYMPHASGSVIGAMSIGHHAVIYHQVTIGAKDIRFTYDERPVIGNNVLIASGARIIGAIDIGDGCVVAANAVVNRSAEQGCLLAGVPATVARRRSGSPTDVISTATDGHGSA